MLVIVLSMPVLVLNNLMCQWHRLFHLILNGHFALRCSFIQNNNVIYVVLAIKQNGILLTSITQQKFQPISTLLN